MSHKVQVLFDEHKGICGFEFSSKITQNKSNTKEALNLLFNHSENSIQIFTLGLMWIYPSLPSFDQHSNLYKMTVSLDFLCFCSSRKMALTSFKLGNKQAAFRCIRQSKMLSESRSKYTSLLDRVEKVLSNIANAESTKKVTYNRNVIDNRSYLMVLGVSSTHASWTLCSICLISGFWSHPDWCSSDEGVWDQHGWS